jgi:hypothetical protein
VLLISALSLMGSAAVFAAPEFNSPEVNAKIQSLVKESKGLAQSPKVALGVGVKAPINNPGPLSLSLDIQGSPQQTTYALRAKGLQLDLKGISNNYNYYSFGGSVGIRNEGFKVEANKQNKTATITDYDGLVSVKIEGSVVTGTIAKVDGTVSSIKWSMVASKGSLDIRGSDIIAFASTSAYDTQVTGTVNQATFDEEEAAILGICTAVLSK